MDAPMRIGTSGAVSGRSAATSSHQPRSTSRTITTPPRATPRVARPALTPKKWAPPPNVSPPGVGEAFRQAARNGQKDTVKSLLPQAAQNDREFVLYETAREGDKEIVELLLAYGTRGDRALVEAARKGDKEIVDLALAYGANVNAGFWICQIGMIISMRNGYLFSKRPKTGTWLWWRCCSRTGQA